eukprot:comp23766_c0_seq2/m.41163 comp23766_c0_seq2/g.41163  ORF comp23766_c0_seq2/g.41163 comp23766_c0_seq2/m.41163 type:complete len:582 (-) comp23766_c0_seq2:152-1897(-)
MKIVDKVNAIRATEAEGDHRDLFSLEFFPPKTVQGPLFVDITWGAGGSSTDLTTEISRTAQNVFGLDTMMHLTCTNTTKEALRSALQQAKDFGLKNILALRGDPPLGSKKRKSSDDDCQYAVDLVRLIREEHGDHFGVAVAGFPEGHPEGSSYANDLANLKIKVDAGADFVITQLFYDPTVYLQFVKDCRAIGIMCPIIPGLMPIASYKQFLRVTGLTKVLVPKDLAARLAAVKNDDEAVQEIGKAHLLAMVDALRQAGTHVFHFYTMNLEAPLLDILAALNTGPQEDYSRHPFHTNSTPTTRRSKEDIRPIYWRHRPKSYMLRTAQWDRFPNGRWGVSSSPGYGELNDYHLLTLHTSAARSIVNCGRALKSEQDVWAIFADFLLGQFPNLELPWYNDPLASETGTIQSRLVQLCRHGFLTINSQPAANGTPSDDPVFGWGPPNGHCYQKAYLEFFCSPELLSKLQEQLANHPNLAYVAASVKDDFVCSPGFATTAVTWGIFPNHEVQQPTVVDPDSFRVWKQEAFSIWRAHWMDKYPVASRERKVMEGMFYRYHLVSMVDNNYINGDIFEVFDPIIAQEK